MNMKVAIIVPIYNEAECLDQLMSVLFKLRNKSSFLYDLIFVNDGSVDSSEIKLLNFSKKYSFVKVLNFTRNFGHQAALQAGLTYAKNYDFYAIIDADLQDPPELIPKMINYSLKNNFDIVYGKRTQRAGELLIKKITAFIFYRLLKILCDIEIPSDTGDFRIFKKNVRNVLVEMKEKHKFFRGMIPWTGFSSSPLFYERNKRYLGETKYSFTKMFNLAFDGIYSFSTAPIKLFKNFGFILILIGLFLIVYVLYLKLYSKEIIDGLSITLIFIFVFSGFNIFFLGVLGEYISRIYIQVQDRPVFLIKSKRNI